MKNEPLWVVTGAAGFLGNTIVRQLLEAGQRVRACVMEEERPESLRGLDCDVVRLDVRDPDSVRAALRGGGPVWVIHAVGVVSIASQVSPEVRDVNVGGTRNVITAARAEGVERLVYVSSVHAIAEPDPPGVITKLSEPEEFDPSGVVGEYAKTKAEATAQVLAADDLWRVIVHPSGMVGPGDYADTRLTALVRDVAAGTIAAAQRGRTGRCYILSGQYASVRDLAVGVAQAAGRKKTPPVLPMWVARAIVPFAEAHYRVWRLTPQFTKYSLYTLLAASDFSHARASEELDYTTRPVQETLADTVDWVRRP